MTLRLVALMTFVLLLCLASFALLLSHYQSSVNAELARTVSLVGQETVRSLDLTWAIKGDEKSATLSGHSMALQNEVRVVKRVMSGQTAADCADGTVAAGFVMIQREGEAAKFIPFGDREVCKTAPAVDHMRERIPATDEKLGPQKRMFVRVEEVHAEQEPGKGLLLRIPAIFDADPKGLGHELASTTGSSTGAGMKREIVLPISTRDFEQLYASMRRRSLLLFVLVMVVGIGLSTALAHRFTRPVRRLDSAFTLLSDGNLDVEVEREGTGEIARLGDAFNSMARKLRANRARERDLTRRERLASLGRLAAGVAHDVRNPLHSIGLTLQHIQETCRPEAPDQSVELDRALGIIRGEIRRLDELVEGFLRFTRNDRRESQPVDVPSLLREVAQLVEKEAERRTVRVIVEAEDVPELLGDPSSIRSAVLNLIMNGFDAIQGNGTLTLSAHATADAVWIGVRDDGRGIPEEEQEKVFDFAYTTRDGGHGLGLAMVHQVVVEEHGGHVRLSSRPGEGTRVELEFPRLQAVST